MKLNASAHKPLAFTANTLTPSCSVDGCSQGEGEGEGEGEGGGDGCNAYNDTKKSTA